MNMDESRQKALTAALAQIEKAHGAGAAMMGGQMPETSISAIPTGSLRLDAALGIGGVPRGRIIEVFGPESGGKCLTADTLIPTNWGLLSVAEIFERCGMTASCTSRVTDISEFGLQIINEQGEREPVSHLTHNGRRQVLRLTTDSGKSIRVTANHPMRVLSQGGWLVWKKASDIAEGDVLLGVLGGFDDAPDAISTDEATLLGYLIGDGACGHPSKLSFTQLDEQVSAEFDALMVAQFPGLAGKVYESRPLDTRYHSKAARTALLEKGLAIAKSAEKAIPWTVRASGHGVHKAFLSALFECDGCIEDHKVTLTTASPQLAAEVQAMLAGLGLVSSVTARTIAAYPDREYFTVRLGGASSRRFIDEIGFRSDRRAVQVKASNLSVADSRRGIPNLKDLVITFRDAVEGDRDLDRIIGGLLRPLPGGNDLRATPVLLERLLQWADDRGFGQHPLAQQLRMLASLPASFERVTSVSGSGAEPTFDLVVPGSHSFVANGLATHNTTMALHIAANAQRLGGLVAFIDAEHALDPTYAQNLGVNFDDLVISQPDSGEQALEIADTLIRSGAMDLVIVDSVAALVPRAELEGEMGDAHVGLQARLMSQALRKITAALSNSDTSAIFINQLREKIGMMGYGSPETTPGGRALKFYASVRLDVRRIGGVKAGEDAIGNRTRIKVVKNKVAPPFKQAEIDIIYGEGISREAELIDLGVELGVVKKSGAWFTMDGDQLGQGKEKAREFLKDNPGLAEELELQVKSRLQLIPAPDIDPAGVADEVVST